MSASTDRRFLWNLAILTDNPIKVGAITTTYLEAFDGKTEATLFEMAEIIELNKMLNKSQAVIEAQLKQRTSPLDHPPILKTWGGKLRDEVIRHRKRAADGKPRKRNSKFANRK